MKRKILFSILACLLIAIVLWRIGLFDSTMENMFQSLDKNRPAESYLIPDCSGNVTDVRITAVERETNAYSLLPGEKDSPVYGTTCVQIYYGYQKDGMWFDMPCENYDLRAIASSDTGYDAAEEDHIVKIGPYLLFAFKANAAEGEVQIEISDTLDSQALLMFGEYFTRVWHEAQENSYSYLKEDRSSFDNAENVNSMVYADFDQCAYLILDYSAIPDDYVLSVRKTCGTNVKEFTLNYQSIMDLLGSAE